MTDVPQVVAQLRALKGRFDGGAVRRRAVLLRTLARLPLADEASLCAYHDQLLFTLAHPDNVVTRRMAEREIRRIAQAARRIAHRSSGGTPGDLDDSGIAYSTTTYAWSNALASWLVNRCRGDVELAWDDESLGDEFDEFLHLLMPSAERDGLLEGALTTRRWLELARGAHQTGDLAWLLGQVRLLPAEEAVRDRLYDALDMPIRWRLRGSMSRTLNRFPRRPPFYQRAGLERSADARAIIEQPLEAPRCLGRAAAEAMIDVGRAALAVRHRETDPLTYANPREVMLIRLERGIDVALYGMLPDRRLPLESFFGYVAAKNRVPVAYGGGWVFLDRCEIGINVFDEFRGGESAYLFSQLLRVYRHTFAVRRFTVDPFQFGKGNPEAIQSGAFWFYDRLGFRPVSQRLARLAAEERECIEADGHYRTPPAVLRRLARSELALDLPGAAATAPDLKAISLAVTARIGRSFRGDRRSALAAAVRRVQSALGADIESCPSPERRRAFARLCPLVATINDLGRWSREERDALKDLMFTKGGPGERAYVRKLQQHDRFAKALTAIAVTAPVARP